MRKNNRIRACRHQHLRAGILTFLLLVLLLFHAGAYAASIDGAPLPWKFAVISDTQSDNREGSEKSCINDAVVRAIARDIVKEHPDFVLVSGDLVNGWLHNSGTDYAAQFSNWRAAMAPVYEAGIRIYPIRGNHEDGPERLALPPLPAHLEPPPDTREKLKQAFRHAFSDNYIPQNGPDGEKGLTYSFSHKNVLVIGIDLYSDTQHKTNLEWIGRELAANKQPHIFVYGHEPAFGVIHRDNLGFFPDDRDAFWDVLGGAGVRVYFCGHDHLYNRAVISDRAGNQIRQIVASTGGGALKTWQGEYLEGTRVQGEYGNMSHHGYVLVTIAGPAATIVWKALSNSGNGADWQALDSYSYTLDNIKDKKRDER